MVSGNIAWKEMQRDSVERSNPDAAEIRRAFARDPNFAQWAVENGKTLHEAKAEYCKLFQ